MRKVRLGTHRIISLTIPKKSSQSGRLIKARSPLIVLTGRKVSVSTDVTRCLVVLLWKLSMHRSTRKPGLQQTRVNTRGTLTAECKRRSRKKSKHCWRPMLLSGKRTCLTSVRTSSHLEAPVKNRNRLDACPESLIQFQECRCIMPASNLLIPMLQRPKRLKRIRNNQQKLPKICSSTLKTGEL